MYLIIFVLWHNSNREKFFVFDYMYLRVFVIMKLYGFEMSLFEVKNKNFKSFWIKFRSRMYNHLKYMFIISCIFQLLKRRQLCIIIIILHLNVRFIFTKIDASFTRLNDPKFIFSLFYSFSFIFQRQVWL